MEFTTFEPTAKVICDSISPVGKRLTTIEATIHRFVLAELNTHRVFSRNSASSRAIPIEKMIKRVEETPAMPVWWGKNQSGMSAREELSGKDLNDIKFLWMSARNDAVGFAKALNRLGLHKQLANRLLEPWLPHTVIISATEWDNFFWQRCHPDAQPEMKAAADAIQLAYYTSEPKLVKFGDWHLPYLAGDEWDLTGGEQLMVSTARCARVSYLTHDGVRDKEEDLRLYYRLRNANPMHASPFEHVATPDPDGLGSGNFRGWKQYRSFVEPPVKPFKPNHPKLVGQTS